MKGFLQPARFLSMLADETRLRLLVLLAEHGELCVCELTHALGQSQPKISRHLARLREERIVKDRREGLWIHYRLNDDLQEWALEILHTLAKAMGRIKPYQTDRRQALQAPVRPPSRCNA